MKQAGGSKCFGQTADDADWSISVDSKFDANRAVTKYTFVLDTSSSNSSCGTPDSLSLRVREGAPVVAVSPAPVSSKMVDSGCDKSGLMNTIRWENFTAESASSNGSSMATFEVELAGEVADLCAEGVRVVDAAGRVLSGLGDAGCTFTVSSSSCCRHGLAEVVPQ
jgi:hypothetical protein